MSGLTFRPLFTWGETGRLLLTLPIRPARPVEGSVGGHDFSAAGVPAGHTVRDRSDLVLPLRFFEDEWPAVRGMIRALQIGALAYWAPEADKEATTWAFYLVSPVAGEEFQPVRDPAYPSVYSMDIQIRSTGTPFDVRFFSTMARG